MLKGWLPKHIVKVIMWLYRCHVSATDCRMNLFIYENNCFLLTKQSSFWSGETISFCKNEDKCRLRTKLSSSLPGSSSPNAGWATKQSGYLILTLKRTLWPEVLLRVRRLWEGVSKSVEKWSLELGWLSTGLRPISLCRFF